MYETEAQSNSVGKQSCVFSPEHHVSKLAQRGGYVIQGENSRCLPATEKSL